MLFLRSWIEEFIDLSEYSDNQIREIITKKSSEVEEIKYVNDYFGGKVVVAQVQNLRKHPDADRLQVFDAKISSDKTVQIVSAAPNLREEMIIPLALVGAVLPDLTISARPMRGEASNGMVCGKSEILLEDGHSSGVWDLEREFTDANKTVVLGQSICEAFPQYFPREVLFDIKVLPNRVGVFGSYMGLAMELAMIIQDWELLKQPVKRLLNPNELIKKITEKYSSKTYIKTKFTDDTGYTNTFCLFDMDLGEGEYTINSEAKKRMFLTGINLVGGLTDFSNYLLHEIGQPTHFFSKSKLAKQDSTEFIVKVVDTPTQFKGLGNLKDKTLPIGTRVLVDQNDNILAIPAISGGAGTKMEIDESSSVVEIANFDSSEVSRNSFLLKYRSGGTKFWSGNVNQLLTLVCLMRLGELFGDSISVNCVWDKAKGNTNSLGDIFTNEIGRNKIAIDIEYIANKIDSRGLEYWSNIIKSKLNIIGQYSDGLLEIEPFYSNLETKEDVVEEVVRLVGFDDMITEPIISSSDSVISGNYKKFQTIKDIFVSYGLSEVILRPFVSKDKLLLGEGSMEVVKSYRSDEPFLRDTLLTSLMESVSGNIKKGEKEPKIFENNKIHYHRDGVVSDRIFIDSLITSNDPYLATSIVWAVLNSIKHGAVEIQDAEIADEIGQGKLFSKNGVTIKLIQISNKLKKKYDIALTKTLWWVTTDLTSWDGSVNVYNNYFDESDYPEIKRSYSLLVDRKLKWEVIQNTINSLSIENAEIAVKPVERFSEDNQKDVVNLEIDFVSQTRTLESKEVEQIEHRMIEILSKDFFISIR